MLILLVILRSALATYFLLQGITAGQKQIGRVAAPRARRTAATRCATPSSARACPTASSARPSTGSPSLAPAGDAEGLRRGAPGAS